MAKQKPTADEPAIESKKPIRGLRTFASDKAALQRKKEKPDTGTEATQAKTAEKKTAPEPIPQAKPITPHKEVAREVTKPIVTKLDEAGEHIPAFHELNTTDSDTPKTQIAIDDSEGAFGGTIITDTKKGRFKLFPTIGVDIRNWWKRITTPKKKTTNTYAVPEAGLRKDVIQKATSKTGTIFTSDNETLRESIRKRSQNNTSEEESELTHEAETIWSPNTESGYALLEAPEINETQINDVVPLKNVEVTFKKHTTPAAPKPEPKPLAPKKEKSAVEDSKSEEKTSWVHVPTEPEKEIPPTPTPPPVTPPPASVVAAPKPKPVIPRKERRRSYRSTHWLDFDTNILSVVIFVAIIGFISTFFVSRGFIDFVLPSQTTQVESASQPLLKSAPQRDMLLTNLTPLAVEEVLQLSQKSFGNSLQEIRLMLSADKPLSSTRFLSIIEAEVEPSFALSIPEVRLAVSNRPTRAIVFGVSDSIAAQGGMLAWEDTMLSAVTNVFRSGTTSSTTIGFIDEQINSVDVRVLYSINGTARVVYGFIDDTTIVITPNHAQFRTVIDHN